MGAPAVLMQTSSPSTAGIGSIPASPGAAALRHNSPAPRCRGWVFLERKERNHGDLPAAPLLLTRENQDLQPALGPFPVPLLSVSPDLSRLARQQRPGCSNWDFFRVFSGAEEKCVCNPGSGSAKCPPCPPCHRCWLWQVWGGHHKLATNTTGLPTGPSAVPFQ